MLYFCRRNALYVLLTHGSSRILNLPTVSMLATGNMWADSYVYRLIYRENKKYEEMIMKKIILLVTMACALLAGQDGHAKSMKDMWLSMPDSLAPVLSQNMRLEMVELQDMKVKAEVANALGDSCVMDTLTHNFLQVQLSKVCLLQAKLLPFVGGDSILCVVKTFSGPEKESEVTFYGQDWHQVDATHLFDGHDFAALYDRLVQKPDTMSDERFVQLKSMIEPRMLNAILFEHDNSMVVRLALPLLSADDKKLVNVIKKQIKFNWNGDIFNES